MYFHYLNLTRGKPHPAFNRTMERFKGRAKNANWSPVHSVCGTAFLLGEPVCTPSLPLVLLLSKKDGISEKILY